MRPSSSKAGFTLIELVMSLFILGLVTSAVVWTLPDTRPLVVEEAVRLAAKLNAAQDESIVSGETIGVAFKGHSYAFYRYRAGAWIAVMDSPVLAVRELDAAVQLLPNGGSRVGEAGLFNDGPTQSGPTVYFSPVGVPPVFAVTLSGQSGSAHVRSTAQGGIEVVHDRAS